jgi:hypothetical protein
MNNLVKFIFYKQKIQKNWTTSDDEALKQWVLKQDINKSLDKDIHLLEKAKTAINDMLEGNVANSSDMEAYLNIRKRYKYVIKQNTSELYNPTMEDVLVMDSLTIDEINETMVDRKETLFKRYYRSIQEIYSSSQNGIITSPTSGGLRKSETPTNDFIDDLPSAYNPMDDLGVD